MGSKPNPVLKLQLGKELSVQNCFLVPYNTYIEYISTNSLSPFFDMKQTCYHILEKFCYSYKTY